MNNSTPSGRLGHYLNPLKRARTPIHHDDVSVAGESTADKELNPVQERRQRHMRDLYARSERLIRRLFDGSLKAGSTGNTMKDTAGAPAFNTSPAQSKTTPQPKKRAAREIEEDDYGEDEEEDEDSSNALAMPYTVAQTQEPEANEFGSTLATSSRRATSLFNRSVSKEMASSPEEARKRLDQEKQAAETAAKESFLTTIYTLENDREAMLEQQKLDELDRQVETETSTAQGPQQTSIQTQSMLNNTALGSAHLTMPHLVAKLDSHRHKIKATDAQIKALLSNARVGGGKWAHPEYPGRERLYESCEQVINNLKAQIQHSGPFLQSVKRRDYPDYHKVISKPMDIGTMLKKLHKTEYRNKKEFTDDLDQIWANCFKYNADPAHPLRKKAEHMKKEAAKLTPLIPDMTIRDSAEGEPEEREEEPRGHPQFDDSDDDDAPIAATRGRKAPNKGNKGGTAVRKAPPTVTEDSPPSEPRPLTQSQLSGGGPTNVRSDVDSVLEGSQNGISTPPIGNHTPLGAGGLLDGTATGNQADISELESINASMHDNNALDQVEDPAEEDEEYKVWKQVTMRDRARMAAERHRLFLHDRLNLDEPALLRTKAGMRRWMRQQRTLIGDQATSDLVPMQEQGDNAGATPAYTLAEDMDADDDSALPDYYYPLSGVPAIDSRLQWVEDAQGNVTDRRDKCLRLLPPDYFSMNQDSKLVQKMEDNMKVMQDTRRTMARIGMVKQMQLQTQTYQNQFQKYQPQGFKDKEIDAMAVSDEGPYMQPTISRAALQRSIGKIFFHAGFEDYQPSALDAVTNVASEYFQTLATTLLTYHEHPKVNPAVPESLIDAAATAKSDGSPIPVINEWQPRFTAEEAILHTIQRGGHDLEGLNAYIEDDMNRLGQKLHAHHEASTQHYTDLLRPAMDPAIAARDGGASAFNDGSEQFLTGDFGEDIDEDIFGFRSLGLDKEFGITLKSIPLHLLQSRINTANQPAAGANAGNGEDALMTDPPRWAPVTGDSIGQEIGLVQAFFKDKLEKTGGAPLTEDEDLPAKQRFPKPRLPPTGKISSPRKRPIREQQMMQRKKRRLEIEAERERERQGQEGPTAAATSANEDGHGGGTVAVANVSGPENIDMSGALTTDVGGAPNTDAGAEADSEDFSRRTSVAQPSTLAGNSMTNGILSNGEVDHDSTEQSPTLPKQLTLDKPKEDQLPDTDPEKRGSMPIAAH